MVDNDGDAVEDVTFQFRFRTDVRNPNTFLYNTGPITSLDAPTFNVRQFYSVTRIDGPRRRGRGTMLGDNLPTPPVNVGFRSIAELRRAGRGRACASCRTTSRCLPGSATIRSSSTSTSSTCSRVPPADTNNLDWLAGFNVHSIAIEVPDLAADANGARPATAPRSERRHRRVVHGQPAVGDEPRRRTGSAQRALRAGVAARPAARQRGRDPARRQGRVQLARADRDAAALPLRDRSGSAEAAARRSSASSRRRRRATTSSRSS